MSTSNPEIYQTTFGFNNSGAWSPLTISLEPKNSKEYSIVFNGVVVDDIEIPGKGETTSEYVDWASGELSLKGTFELSLGAGGNRYWLVLKDPDIVRPNWSGLTDGTDAVGGQFVIATWSGDYSS
jgi:hypothetical protein